MNTQDTKETGVEDENPYNGFAKELFARYQKDIAELTTNAVRSGFPAPKDPHHQELQKVRHDWLREEIVKLEGMKKKKNSIKHFSGNGYFNQQGFNQALQTIIDRYHSELDQPNK